MKGYDFLHLVLVVLTLRGFAQATYRSNIKKKVVGKFKKKFQKKFLLIKKLEIEKDYFYYISFKSCIHGGRELSAKKIPSSCNSALHDQDLGFSD